MGLTPLPARAILLQDPKSPAPLSTQSRQARSSSPVRWPSPSCKCNDSDADVQMVKSELTHVDSVSNMIRDASLWTQERTAKSLDAAIGDGNPGMSWQYMAERL